MLNLRFAEAAFTGKLQGELFKGASGAMSIDHKRRGMLSGHSLREHNISTMKASCLGRYLNVHIFGQQPANKFPDCIISVLCSSQLAFPYNGGAPAFIL